MLSTNDVILADELESRALAETSKELNWSNYTGYQRKVKGGLSVK